MRNIFLGFWAVVVMATAIILGMSGCSSDPFEENTPLAEEQPLSDVELVEQQLSKLHRTRAGNDSLIIVLITTKSAVNLVMVKGTELIIDWGDGEKDTNTVMGFVPLNHQYQDTDPAHTILIYGSNSTVEYLLIPDAGLIYMDVSKNSQLVGLEFGNNRIPYLDVSENSALAELSCNHNRLSFLDVSSNQSLYNLYAPNNQLTSVVLSGNTSLLYLDVSNNDVPAMDLSEAPYLSSLSISNNALSTLDLSYNRWLTSLDCSQNQLTALNLDENSELFYLDCSYTQIDTLDISANPLLENLYCQQNPGLDQITCPPPSDPLEHLSNIDITGTPIADTPNSPALGPILLALPARTALTPGRFGVGPINGGDVSNLLSILGKNWEVY